MGEEFAPTSTHVCGLHFPTKHMQTNHWSGLSQSRLGRLQLPTARSTYTYTTSLQSPFPLALPNLANLSAKLLAEGGLLTLIGAAGAVGPTPGMLGYGMAKAATHHLVQSLAVDDGLSAGFSGTLVRCDIAAVLPGVIDTPANRT